MAASGAAETGETSGEGAAMGVAAAGGDEGTAGAAVGTVAEDVVGSAVDVTRESTEDEVDE